MHEAVIGLGSNLGSRRALLNAATDILARTPGLQVLGRSRLYHSAPLGPPQPNFLNAAVLVRWVGNPHGLLDVLQHVEALLGRERRLRWGPRTLDLDLLWWSGTPVRTPRLCVPHPALEKRAFALAPLLDVIPAATHRYERALELAGKNLSSEAWNPHGPLACEDPTEAVAQAASRLTLAWGPHQAEPLSALAWNPTPVGESFEPALGQLVQALEWGFRTHCAVVLEQKPPATHDAWRGRLLGWYTPAQVRMRNTMAP